MDHLAIYSMRCSIEVDCYCASKWDSFKLRRRTHAHMHTQPAVTYSITPDLIVSFRKRSDTAMEIPAIGRSVFFGVVHSFG